MTIMKNAAKNLEDVHEMNLNILIKLMLKNKLCSRVQLAQESGLRQSTVTNLMNELIDAGLACETGNIDGKKGRRSIGVMLYADRFRVLGIRLARTHFSVGIFGLDGDMPLHATHQISASVTSQALLSQIERVSSALMKESCFPIAAVGLAAPGPIISDKGSIAFVTGTLGWDKINFRTELSQRLKLPIFLEQDANAGALAELWFGQDRFSSQTFVYLAAGPGIGAGIVEDGRIFHGGMGMAGEIGHMSINYDGELCQCGNQGCLELYCSTTALLQNVRACIQRGECTLNPAELTLPYLAQSTDPCVCAQIDRVCCFLGRGIVNLINLYAPDVIIIGDELATLGDRLLRSVEATVASYVRPEVLEHLTIRLTDFEMDPALPGAAAVAFSHLLQKPTSSIHLQSAAQTSAK